MMPAIAWIDASRLTQGSLAVVGAAVIGGLLCGFATRMLAHTIAAKQAPLLLLRFARIGGGLAAGFAASLFFFGGPGGWGIGGAGPGDGGAKTTETSVPVTLVKQSQPAAARPLRITMLGGDRVRGLAFYQLDNESTARTLDGVKEHVAQMRQRDEKPASVEIVVGPDSVAADHSAVRDLEAWAKEAGFRVDINLTGGNPRP